MTYIGPMFQCEHGHHDKCPGHKDADPHALEGGCGEGEICDCECHKKKREEEERKKAEELKVRPKGPPFC